MNFLKEHGSEIVRTIVLSLLAAIGLILTPVRDWLQDWVRPEQVRVAIQSPDSVVAGHTLDVSFLLIPKTTTTISGGTLTFELSPAGNLVLDRPGPSQLPVSQIKDVVTIPTTPLRFRALRSGEIGIKAVFINRKQQKNGTFKKITIAPIGTGGPSELDYNGNWQFESHYGGQAFNGELCMRDDSGNLSGSYSLISGGERGTISGQHDGQSFWAFLKPSGDAKGWFLEGGGATPIDGQYLQIKGNISLCSKEPCPTLQKSQELCSKTSALQQPCFRLSSSVLVESAKCGH